MADQLTPVLAYRCLIKEDDREAPSFLFESVTNGTQQVGLGWVGGAVWASCKEAEQAVAVPAAMQLLLLPPPLLLLPLLLLPLLLLLLLLPLLLLPLLLLLLPLLLLPLLLLPPLLLPPLLLLLLVMMAASCTAPHLLPRTPTASSAGALQLCGRDAGARDRGARAAGAAPAAGAAGA